MASLLFIGWVLPWMTMIWGVQKFANNMYESRAFPIVALLVLFAWGALYLRLVFGA